MSGSADPRLQALNAHLGALQLPGSLVRADAVAMAKPKKKGKAKGKAKSKAKGTAKGKGTGKAKGSKGSKSKAAKGTTKGKAKASKGKAGGSKGKANKAEPTPATSSVAAMPVRPWEKARTATVKKDIEKQRKWLKQQRAKLPPPPKKPKAAPVPRKRGEDPLIVRARFVCSRVCRPAVPA